MHSSRALTKHYVARLVCTLTCNRYILNNQRIEVPQINSIWQVHRQRIDSDISFCSLQNLVSLHQRKNQFLLYNKICQLASAPNLCAKNSSSCPQLGTPESLDISEGNDRMHPRICLISRCSLTHESSKKK